jgi:Na+/H+ antiporter NhaD/arsenite permease-like protein
LIVRKIAPAAVLLLAVSPAHAAPPDTLDGASLSLLWCVPFVGILLSIAVLPLVAPHFWHRHYGKVSTFWVFALLVPLFAVRGGAPTASALAHTILQEYLPFIVLLFALYTVAGGILVTGNLRGTPATNGAILATGTLMASFVGTTGASMILIRPLLQANAHRRHRTHVVIFFIFLVANIGGALSPLGDPPLFIGFLRGVDFFWTTQHIWLQTLIVSALVLAVFFVVDSYFHRADPPRAEPRPPTRIRVRGMENLALLALIVAVILLSAWWKPGATFPVFGANLELQEILRDTTLVLIALASLRLTRDEHRASNGFTWEPIREVAILFAGIFIAIIPALAMLQAGRNGPFAWLLQAVTYDDGMPHEVAYFWLTGVLSAFLDNAPTYLVFFELAGGDPERLMGPLAGTLAAISMGAVYMGALTYIGNAPNFMIFAIARDRGIGMPSFFGYMVWSSIVLFPVFVLLTLLPSAPVLRSP